MRAGASPTACLPNRQRLLRAQARSSTPCIMRHLRRHCANQTTEPLRRPHRPKSLAWRRGRRLSPPTRLRPRPKPPNRACCRHRQRPLPACPPATARTLWPRPAVTVPATTPLMVLPGAISATPLPTCANHSRLLDRHLLRIARIYSPPCRRVNTACRAFLRHLLLQPPSPPQSANHPLVSLAFLRRRPGATFPSSHRLPLP